MIASWTSAIQAAILIAALEISRALGIRPGSVEEICQATGASRSQAYEMLARLRVALEGLRRRPGRPRKAVEDRAERQLLMAARDLLMEHPGCVEGRGKRRIYHPIYRDFVIRQLTMSGPAASLTLEQASEVLGVPQGTLKTWLGSGAEPPSEEGSAAVEETSSGPAAPSVGPSDPGMATIVREYPRWKGSFDGFCRFLSEQWRLSYGRTFVASVLEAIGLRRPRRRGRDERPWSRGTFRELFPGAQWIGDGKSVPIDWLGTPMVFNLEALVDTASNGVVGLEVSDSEDQEAVLAAHAQARSTTGGDPLAVSLDQRPSNHTERVRDAVAPAELLATTPGRPTAKAPMEGSFGLFSQTAPPLVVTGTTPRERARSVVRLVGLVWAWARNHKPRRRLGERSPAQAYQEASPTAEQIAEAQAWIAELKRRQDQTRRTLDARADPVRLQLLKESFEALGILDPEDRLATSLAAYCSQEAIVRGLATFRAKTELETIPPDADRGRYLAGIIRNIHARLEDELVAQQLLELRLRQRDLSLGGLEREAVWLARNQPVPTLRAMSVLERALAVEPVVDFRFWLAQLRDILIPLPRRTVKALYRSMTSIVARSYSTPRDRRRELIALASSCAVLAVG